MAEGTTAIDLALTTEGDADGSDLITFAEGTFVPTTLPEGPLQYIQTHEEIAVRKLAPPFWGKPFVAALLQAFIAQIQELEDTLWQMLELRTLAGADLPRLKVLGKIVGQPQLGFDTETYRIVIEARARANRSRGTARDILDVLNILVGPEEYSIREVGDATLYVLALTPITVTTPMRVVLPDTRSAGVGLAFVSSAEAGAGVYGFYHAGGSASAGSFLWDSSASPGAGTPMLGVVNL
ncbi:MAG TPA: hypothetical protein VIU86_20075 [Gaiellaceae bacterium]